MEGGVQEANGVPGSVSVLAHYTLGGLFTLLSRGSNIHAESGESGVTVR